jgi:hypothetical protein
MSTNELSCPAADGVYSNMADFPGDPNFPDKAMRVRPRALKNEYFQGLYKQYSRLGFTRWEDWPIAIAGLEKRLQRAFGTKGRYGIFEDGNKPDGGLFYRSLLWRRAWDSDEKRDDDALEVITFSAERRSHIPSWSWMAYKGCIDGQDPEANEYVAIAAVARDLTSKAEIQKKSSLHTILSRTLK